MMAKNSDLYFQAGVFLGGNWVPTHLRVTEKNHLAVRTTILILQRDLCQVADTCCLRLHIWVQQSWIRVGNNVRAGAGRHNGFGNAAQHARTRRLSRSAVDYDVRGTSGGRTGDIAAVSPRSQVAMGLRIGWQVNRCCLDGAHEGNEGGCDCLHFGAVDEAVERRR